LAFNEDNVLGADSTFFDFFDFPLKEGDPTTALMGINKVVISAEVAIKLFGNEPALGKTLLFGDEKIPVEITGVTEKQPDNLHFHFDYLISIYTNPGIKKFDWSWIWTQVVTYVKLKPGASADAFEEKIQSIVDSHVKPSFASDLGMDFDEFMKGKGDWEFQLLPVEKIHLYGTDNRIGTVRDIKYLYIFGIVALFVLIIAVINYVNLATARSQSRAKEVGVKKVLGALRHNLFIQFQLESVLLAIVATILGLGILELLRILIAAFFDLQLNFSVWNDPLLIWLIPVLPFFIGALAGLYPALYLTSFQPARVLKGRASGVKGAAMRNGLVGLQYVISIVFMVVTVVVYNQLEFFRNADIGFNRENVLVIDNAEKLGNQLVSFREELSNYSGVKAASISMSVPGRGGYEDIFGDEGGAMKISISQVKIDEYYFEALGLELIAGRMFEKEREYDKYKIVITESTGRAFGWTPDEALGKYITDYSGKLEVIGVVKDYHNASLHRAIAPAMFTHIDSPLWGDMRVVVLKVKGGQTAAVINAIEKEWKTMADNTPLQYSFLDEEWEKLYQEEVRMGGLFSLFTTLSILIASIGLVGLVTYAGEKRKKEIGVRKVVGASSTQVVMLLNKNFTRLIVIAFVIAVPIAWYVIQQWLSQFEYKEEVGAWPFVLAGITVILITWITVSYQSFKASRINPVEVLKAE
jgi:putative ABC transport system permease protein